MKHIYKYSILIILLISLVIGYKKYKDNKIENFTSKEELINILNSLKEISLNKINKITETNTKTIYTEQEQDNILVELLYYVLLYKLINGLENEEDIYDILNEYINILEQDELLTKINMYIKNWDLLKNKINELLTKIEEADENKAVILKIEEPLKLSVINKNFDYILNKYNNISLDYDFVELYNSLKELDYEYVPKTFENEEYFIINNDNPKLRINNFNSENLTLFFTMKCIDGKYNIIETNNNKNEILSFNLENKMCLLKLDDEIIIQTKQLLEDNLYFIMLTIEKSNIKIQINSNYKIDRDIEKNIDINNVILFNTKEKNTKKLEVGNIKLFNKFYTTKEICDKSNFCVYRIDKCSSITDNNKCNETINYYGLECKDYVECDAINPYSVYESNTCKIITDREKCEKNNKCRIISSSCEPKRKIVSETINNNINNTEKIVKNCLFVPEGDNKLHCLDKCLSQKRYNETNELCDENYCKNKCESCDNNVKCKWLSTKIEEPISIYKIPKAPKIKGYSGDKMIKIIWIKPKSDTIITNYTIILESPKTPELLEINFPSDLKCETCEYTIKNLENDILYNIYLIASNQEGNSPSSNIISIKPINNSEIPEAKGIENIYTSDLPNIDHSIQEINKVTKIDMIQDNLNNKDNKDEYDIIRSLLINEKLERYNKPNINYKINIPKF